MVLGVGTEESQMTPAILGSDGVVLAKLAAPTSSRPVRLGVLADAHVASRETGTDRLFHRTEARFEMAIDRLNAADPDLVLFDGDLTKDGEPWNVERVESLLGDLEVPFLATPGNHDVPKAFDEHETPTLSTFEERFVPEGLPTHRKVGDVDLVVLNSATLPDGTLADDHRGAISHSQLEWLETTLQVVANPVVAFHHNLLPIIRSDLARREPWRTYSVRNDTAVLDVLERHGVPLVLSGHHHVPATIRLGGLTQVIAPAACAYPQAHLLLDVDDTGTTVRLVPHANDVEQREAYEALCSGPDLRRTFAGLIDDTLSSAPLVDDVARRITPQSPVAPGRRVR